MRAPLSWLREYVALPPDLPTEALAARLTALGLKLEAIEQAGGDLTGPLVLGRVLDFAEEPQKNGKTVRWCSVDVGAANGTGEPQGIVCGARNFAVGDLVVVVLPGGVLPGGFAITARKTYGHLSAGMICSARELGLGDEHDGILVLAPDAGGPGDDATDVLQLRDEVIEFEINPDRAYALSLRGVAREAALGLGAAYTDPAVRDTPPVDGRGWPVEVEDPAGCPVFVTRTVTGLDPEARSPRWLTRRLQLAGMRPVSLPVDVTNYVMLELGQPIHGYDAERLTGPVRVRRARPGERLRTLDGADRALSPEDLLITDDTGPIGLAGVMGGETTEISGSTTSVVVEAAHFDPVSVFRTQRRHKLPSEASKRFERGVDPTLPEAAADRVVELLVQLAGGRAEPGVTKVGQAPPARAITIDTALPARVTGMAIDAATTVAHLQAVGCEVTSDGDRVTAVVPPWRPDLTDPFDLVEEVARVVGYEDVPSVLPQAPAGRGLTPAQSMRRRVGRALAGAGFVEVVSFPFVGPAALDALMLPPDDPRRTALRIANPISAEQPLMTTTLLPGLLEAAARNAGRGQADLALFETATVTEPAGTAAAPVLPVDRRPTEGEWDDLLKAVPPQPLHLALVLTGERERSGWWGPGRRAAWSDALESVRQVAGVLGVPLTARTAAVAPWHPGRCAELVAQVAGRGVTVVGRAGELHPAVCSAFGLPSRSAAAEVDLDVLLELAQPPRGPRLSSFPVAKEDVALVVAEGVAAGDLLATLQEGAGPLLESVRLFDLYRGEQVGEGRKSLAFALRFRAPDRTLTVEETGAARDAAVALAAQRHGAVQRT
ncbi:MAG: Phenylalanyl-tRNA synthetase beta chain [uncultured Nocardioidaceae bacterium]|uniref:Phenylalanine--tRNA ligase beta subunit n=1 Tax=uncultured Nocardioidaceae bacterium TaxID=253824 RepID=A0A6J4MQP6_9ACTN|nr:MAG: Phenylalanyl-tRNA synthetase beta chain [uncultured Nocardioidaceae bacterium]